MNSLSSPDPVSEANKAFRQGLHQHAVSILSQYPMRTDAHSRLREYLLAERKIDALSEILGKTGDPATDIIDEAIAHHLKREFPQAIELCERVLSQDPGNIHAMNHLARAMFNAGQKKIAESILERGLAIDPDFPEMCNNMGHIKRDRGDVIGASRHFQRALDSMPTFVDALMNMGTSLLAQAKPGDALMVFNRVAEIQGTHPDLQVNLGSCLHMMRRYDEARSAYEAAIDMAPLHSLLARRQLGKLLVETGETDAAIEVQMKLIELGGSQPDMHAELASTLEIANRIDEAWDTVVKSLLLFPGHPVLTYEKAKLERRKGNIKEALFTIKGIDPAQIPHHLKQWFYFELGTLLDRTANFDDAYQAFLSSNAIAKEGMRARVTDFKAFDRAMDAMSSWVSRGAPMPKSEDHEDLGEDICFLLGFPRSGTTLLDVMLDGHPGVICLEERQTMEHAFHLVDSQYQGFPDGLSRLDSTKRSEVRHCYRKRLAEFGVVDDGRMIIDKMPIRTPYLGFMLRLFPKAKVLFSLRHPCDVVLSNFMQNYAANEVFVHFYSLEESARIYSKVMGIWAETAQLVHPGAVHYVRYEELIADPDGVLRGVCTYLNLPYTEGLFDHRETLKTRNRIRTNSYHQVAEPIYQRSDGRWKNYLTHMSPVISRLEPAMKFFNYEGVS